MIDKKQVLMVMPVMKGGGAERVAALLVNEFHKNGCKTEFLLTSSGKDEVINRDLNSDIPLSFIDDSDIKENGILKIIYSLLRVISSLLCKPFEAVGKPAPVCFAYLSFVSQYHREIKLMRKKLEKNPEATVISFLQPSIPITLLAARGLPNRIVISERGDPKRQMKKRYGYNFVKKYYQRADAVVFQTGDAMAAYPENVSKKGTVIFNPVNSSLPEPYFGEREKNVTTFCRISRQKNLPLLVESFAEFHKCCGEYTLKIIGEPQNDDDRAVLAETKALAQKLGVLDFIDFQPFSASVHALIIRDAMYVNSSDYEGMSNAMLEAMAIGMPVICTDCPIGGAAAVIRNGENGLLTEVSNATDLCEAMKKIAGDQQFSDKLSRNAAEIRNELSLEATAKKWMELF